MLLKLLWAMILTIGFAAILFLINPIFGILWLVFIGFVVFVTIKYDPK